MLYEVITIVGASEFTDYVAEQIKNLMFKITENYILPHKSFKVLNQGVANGRIVGGNLRITSYNVCYTKLLRCKTNFV